MKNKPLVSIIIPVYNGEDYVKEAIDSALNQTYDNKEIIVVNDGSFDKTETICLKYGKKIKYFSKENGGVSTALNLAIKKASGEYISWLSHDDLYYPNKIEDEVKIANNNTIIYSDYDLIDENGNNIGNIILPHEKLENKNSLPLMKGLINGITLLIPKKAFIDCGEFNIDLKCTQDYDMWFRMLTKGYNFVHLEQSLASSRQHRNQTTNTSTKMVSEGNTLWKNMTFNMPKDIILKDFKTEYSFYKQVASVLKFSPYQEAYKSVVKKFDSLDRTIDVSNKKVSVIIPFYDESIDIIKRAVTSVIEQTHKNLEILLINDNPTNYKRKSINEILTDKRIKYIENKKNSGVSFSRNFGISKATGDYIAFLDADDVFMKDKIEIQLEELERNQAVFSHTSYILHTEDSETIMNSGEQDGDILREIITCCRIATPTVMIKKSVFDEHGYSFEEKIGIGEDNCLWMDILINYEAVGINKPLSIVYVDEQSAAYNNDKQYIGLKNILIHALNDSRINKYKKEVCLLAYNFSRTNLYLSNDDYELQSILNSRSWKITKPLRLASKTVRSLKENGFKRTMILIKRYICKK